MGKGWGGGSGGGTGIDWEGVEMSWAWDCGRGLLHPGSRPFSHCLVLAPPAPMNLLPLNPTPDLTASLRRPQT